MKTDATVWDEKVAQIWETLDQQRFHDALGLATHLTVLDPKKADGWWTLALAAKGLKQWEDARVAVVETIKIVPNSPIVWGTFGEILEALKQDVEAKKAFEKATRIDPNYLFGRWHLMALSKKLEDHDGIIANGQILERTAEINAATLDDIGLAFWHKNNFRMSLQYYKNSVLLEQQSFRYSNLGLIYERVEIAQDLDAYDAYRRALLIDPNNERAKESCLRISQRYSVRTKGMSFSKTSLLPKDDLFRFYINPYRLLGYDQNINVGDISEKDIQKRKKLLLHDIELEDGSVQSLEGHIIDKSRAISLCDELFDESKKTFHSVLFSDVQLNDFLQQGDISLFFLHDEYFPTATLTALDNQAFLAWISPIYAAQYNLVLSHTMERGDLQKIALLLGGRRYVTHKDEDDCFSGASRILDRRMEAIRNAAKDAETQRPSVDHLKEVFAGDKNGPPLNGLLNTLPVQFRPFKDEAFRLFREIYLLCNNKYDDTELTTSVLRLAKTNNSISSELKHMLEADEQSLNKIIQSENVLKTPTNNQNSIIENKANPKTGISAFISTYPKLFILIILIIVGAVWSMVGDNENDNAGTDSSQQQPAQPPVPVPLSTEEDIPPVGTGLTLTDNEIRYCLSQNLRLDGAQSVLNKYNQADVDRYNALTKDYNSRCGNFQYEPGDLQNIQDQVNSNSATLQAQGEALFSK